MFGFKDRPPRQEFDFFLGDLENDTPNSPIHEKEQDPPAPKKQKTSAASSPSSKKKFARHAARNLSPKSKKTAEKKTEKESESDLPDASKKKNEGAQGEKKAPSTPKKAGDSMVLFNFLKENEKEPAAEKSKTEKPRGAKKETNAAFREQSEKKEKDEPATTPSPVAALPAAKKETPKRRPIRAKRDLHKESETEKPPSAEDSIKASLDGMYQVYDDPKKNKKKTLQGKDYLRYGILFVCIFGFLFAGYFVFSKLYDYHRAYVVYSGLQSMVASEDLFADEYLKKANPAVDTLTPSEILEGKEPSGGDSGAAFTPEQETLMGKIAQLKKLNPDTAGWIRINGTVVNYPVVWSAKKNYYLHRDFYGNTLSGGAIFIDERNDADITKNRNTVIYGHNMSDGSMFASIHDFSSAAVFFDATIEIATENGIYIYTPFSVHRSNAHDNYFETDFVSDEDFIYFCEQMAFLSLFETDYNFNKNTQILTLSTCMDTHTNTEERFAVHAILTKVIR